MRGIILLGGNLRDFAVEKEVDKTHPLIQFQLYLDPAGHIRPVGRRVD